MAVFYSAQDFARALLALLPSGRVWPKDLESTQGLFMQALAQVYAADGTVAYLVVDAFPATTVELLPEWENTLGLPDPCAGPSPTLGQRIAQVVARLTDSGGQSVAYFVELARRLGYDITVTQYAPSRFGRRFGSLFGGEAWARGASTRRNLPAEASHSVVAPLASHFRPGATRCCCASCRSLRQRTPFSIFPIKDDIWIFSLRPARLTLPTRIKAPATGTLGYRWQSCHRNAGYPLARVCV